MAFHTVQLNVFFRSEPPHWGYLDKLYSSQQWQLSYNIHTSNSVRKFEILEGHGICFPLLPVSRRQAWTGWGAGAHLTGSKIYIPLIKLQLSYGRRLFPPAPCPAAKHYITFSLTGRVSNSQIRHPLLNNRAEWRGRVSLWGISL